MKTTTININVYELGDIIKIPRKDISLESKRVGIGKSHRAIVVGIMQRMDKLYSYKLLASNGRTFTLKPNEQGAEEYVGHVDLGVLYAGDDDD